MLVLSPPKTLGPGKEVDLFDQSATPSKLHFLRSEKTTHMNSRIIIITRLGVPLSTGPSTILFDMFLKKFFITVN